MSDEETDYYLQRCDLRQRIGDGLASPLVDVIERLDGLYKRERPEQANPIPLQTVWSELRDAIQYEVEKELRARGLME